MTSRTHYEAAVGRAAIKTQKAKDSLRSFLVRKALEQLDYRSDPNFAAPRTLKPVDLIRASTFDLGAIAANFGRGDLHDALLEAEVELARAIDALENAEKTETFTEEGS